MRKDACAFPANFECPYHFYLLLFLGEQYIFKYYIEYYECKQSSLGKRGFYAYRSKHAPEWRGTRPATRNQAWHESPGPRLWRWHNGFARRAARRRCFGRGYRIKPGRS